MTIAIQNGSVCLGDRIEKTDILVDGGKIAEVGSLSAVKSADQIIDATGLYVLPGLIDIHTHLDDRIAGCDLADTYATGTEIAIRNGITTLCTFITQAKDETLADAIAKARSKAEGNCYANYAWHLTPTSFTSRDWLEIEKSIDAGFRTFKFYTTYKHAGIYCAYEQLEEVFKRLTPRGVQFLVHCEDDEILAQQTAEMEQHGDLSKAIAHTQLRPVKAEVEAIRRVIELAGRHQSKVHIVHVSSSEGAELIQQARGTVPITCETAPHYLFLSDRMLRRPDGHRWICSPPLRSEEERALLVRKAEEECFELYATDHCAFRLSDKDAPFSDVRTIPNGLSGIGSLSHLIFKLFEKDVTYSLRQMCLHLAENPARLFGEFPRKGSIRLGADADLAVFNPAGTPKPLRSSLMDVCETYEGMTSTLECAHVLLAGKEVVRNGELVDAGSKTGRWLHEAKQRRRSCYTL
jgi:dihydropyrimidinase